MVEALKKVNFTVKMGDRVWFDSTGGAVAQYEVVNWLQNLDGSFQFKSVGYYDASLPLDKRFVINTNNIIWARGRLEVNGNTLFVQQCLFKLRDCNIKIENIVLISMK